MSSVVLHPQGMQHRKPKKGSYHVAVVDPLGCLGIGLRFNCLGLGVEGWEVRGSVVFGVVLKFTTAGLRSSGLQV